MTSKIDQLLNDAKLHVKQAEEKVQHWKAIHNERKRYLSTIEIIKDVKKPTSTSVNTDKDTF